MIVAAETPLKRWGAGPGRHVAVVGMGGLGHMAVKIAAAWSPLALIIFRLVQGCFGALLIPQGFSILLRSFRRARCGRLLRFKLAVLVD